MRLESIRGRIPLTLAASALCAALAAPALGQVSDPNFDGVAFAPLNCAPGTEPAGDESPSSADLVGDAGHSPIFYARDASYLYFRYRVNGNPSGPNGFAQNSWVILLQVPSGNPFQHQFELALNGKGATDDFGNTGDTIEISKNDPAIDIDFSPLFNDPAETTLFAQKFDFSSASTANTTPLARIVTADTSFGGDSDYFIDFAFPVSALISTGVVSTEAEIDETLFFPATSTDSNQYNKDRLACPFLPTTDLTIDKSVSPANISGSTTTHVTYTIEVTNAGSRIAKGIIIDDPALPGYFSNITVSASSANPSVTAQVVSTNPLKVKVLGLPIGSSVTVTLAADAHPTCANPTYTNTATASAVNAFEVSDSALLTVGGPGVEVCDGVDNDCDGSVDEGSSLCSDGNVCNGTEQCVSGQCTSGQPLSCSDGNPCTNDSCVPASGCSYTNNTAPCNDGSACTTNDTCGGGSCHGGAAPDCNDHNPCTDDTCIPSSGCSSTPVSGRSCSDGNFCNGSEQCVSGQCTSGQPLSCSDGNPCTNDSCVPASGCSYTNNTAPCNDGSACTTNDTCGGGSCHGGAAPDCNDHNPCTDDTCIPASGCSSTSAYARPCDDGNACTTSDQCNVLGQCAGGPPPSCDDGNLCTDDSCNPASGCAHSNNTVSCDDGDVCTTSDTCRSGSCRGGAALDCGDGDPCTDDACVPHSGCAYSYNTAPCDDGDPCTGQDRCSVGVCVAGGGPPDCNDGNVCTHDACEPGIGCVATPIGSCDGDPRTQGYYKRLCQGPVAGDFLTQNDVDCVNDSCTFSTIDSIPALCDRLYPDPENDKCEQADAQLMALLLNVCRGRISGTMPIDSDCTENPTIGDSVAEADAILCTPSSRTHDQCVVAQCESEEINSSESPGEASLMLYKQSDTTTLLTWSVPSSGGALVPSFYRVWRRAVGIQTLGQSAHLTFIDDLGTDNLVEFQMIAETTELSFVDTTDIGNYQYVVTPVW